MASFTASLLGVLPNVRSEPFHTTFGDGEQQLSSDLFAMQWGVWHEMNGVASLLASFPKVSENIAAKLKFSVPLSKACYLCPLGAHLCKALFLLHPLLNMTW